MMLGALTCRAQAHGEKVTGRLRMAAAVASLAAGVALLALPADPAAATGSQRSLYRTDRVTPYTKNECVGLKKHECITIRSRHTPVGIDRFERIALACPKGFPHVVGWDAKHTEHVSLTLISEPPVPRAHAGSRPPVDTLVVSALNNADARGFAVLFVGCSSAPFNGTSFPYSRHAVPSNHVRFGKGGA